jgi:hypothetical protein
VELQRAAPERLIAEGVEAEDASPFLEELARLPVGDAVRVRSAPRARDGADRAVEDDPAEKKQGRDPPPTFRETRPLF